MTENKTMLDTEQETANDQEAMIRMVMSHEGHLQRSKEKAERRLAIRRFRQEHPILWRIQNARIRRVMKRIDRYQGGMMKCLPDRKTAGQL